jgi:hypothetical protein
VRREALHDSDLPPQPVDLLGWSYRVVEDMTHDGKINPDGVALEAHPLTFEGVIMRGIRPVCGCGWRGDWTNVGRVHAMAEHAAHVHVALGLATAE